MPIERETIIERSAPNEPVVVDRGGNPLGIIGAVVVAALAVILIFWLVNGGTSSGGSSVDVDLPEVSVTD